jgi:hypothetical protein
MAMAQQFYSILAISSLMQTSMGLSMKEGSLILADDMKSLNFSGCKFVLFLGGEQVCI